MKPFQHAKSTVKRYGGHWSDYVHLHTMIDSSKAGFAGTPHRALLHNELGVALARKKFGATVVNSDGVSVPVAAVIEDHLIEDVGFVPSLDDWLRHMSPGPLTRRRRIPPRIAAFANDPLGSCIEIWGGDADTYEEVIAFFDQTAALSPDPRHLWFLHNSFGIFLAEDILGYCVTTPSGRDVPVREIGEHLVQARMHGHIPSVHQFCDAVRLEPWMFGTEVGRGIRDRKIAYRSQHDLERTAQG
jgi:hypothetical protein